MGGYSTEENAAAGGTGDHSVRTVALAVTAGVFLGGVATGVAFPTLPLLDRVLGISAVMLGIVLAANRIARLVMNTPAGQIIDERGARKPMIVGLFVQGLAPFGYVAGLYTPAVDVATLPLIGTVSAPGLVFVASRCFWGLGSAFVFVGAFAVITHLTTSDDRGRWTGYLRGGQLLGFPAGLVVGGLLADLAGYAEAFAVAGVAGLFSTAVALVVLPDVTPEVEPSGGLREVPALLRRDPRVLAVGGVAFSLRFLFAGVLLSTAVLHAETHGVRIGGLDPTGASGVLLGAGTLCMAGATLATGRLSDRVGDRSLIVLPGTLALGVGFTVAALRPTLAGTLAGVALVGVGAGSVGPSLLAYLGDISPADGVGRLGGVYNALGDLGSTLGPLVSLPVANAVGTGPTYLGSAGLAALAGLLTLLALVGTPAAPREATGDPAGKTGDD